MVVHVLERLIGHQAIGFVDQLPQRGFVRHAGTLEKNAPFLGGACPLVSHQAVGESLGFRQADVGARLLVAKAAVLRDRAELLGIDGRRTGGGSCEERRDPDHAFCTRPATWRSMFA